MKRIVSSPPNPGNPTPGHLVPPGKKYRPILRLLNSRSNDWSRERSNVSVPIPDCSSSRQKEQKRGDRGDRAEELLSGRLVACDCMAGQARIRPLRPSLSEQWEERAPLTWLAMLPLLAQNLATPIFCPRLLTCALTRTTTFFSTLLNISILIKVFRFLPLCTDKRLRRRCTLCLTILFG